MTDQELRAMVRDAIVRHTSRAGSGASGAAEPDPARHFRANVAFTLLPLSRGGDGDGPCLIEPAVRCNHCGYCLSYGH